MINGTIISLVFLSPNPPLLAASKEPEAHMSSLEAYMSSLDPFIPKENQWPVCPDQFISKKRTMLYVWADQRNLHTFISLG
ncbi:hypothetical protein ACOMHN_001696 [Nucella lapillus]